MPYHLANPQDVEYCSIITEVAQEGCDKIKVMINRRALYWTVSALTVFVVGAGGLAWQQGLRGSLGIYELFPLLGMLAWLLMWMHYVGGSVKRYFGLSKDTKILKRYFDVTSAIVLALILLHPGLLYVGLFKDGLGLPPISAFLVYYQLTARVALVLGSISLTVFLLFELRRWFREKSWWRYIEWANVIAMFLIFVHAVLIGGELYPGWFTALWVIFGLLLVLSITYNWLFDKNKLRNASKI